MEGIRVLMAAAEAAPFAVLGELAQVMGSLPYYLKNLGCNVRVILPYYPSVANASPVTPMPIGEIRFTMNGREERAIIRGTERHGVLFYFVERDDLYGREGLYQYRNDDGTMQDYEDNLYRFAFFSRAVLEASAVTGFYPRIIHCNSWHTALVPVYLKTIYARSSAHSKTSTLLTIPNMAFQGLFPSAQYNTTGLPWEVFNTNALEYYGMINLLKGGILFADRLNTVSASYANSIRTTNAGCGLEGVLSSRSDALSGIMDGIDYTVWDPATDPWLGDLRFAEDSLEHKLLLRANLLRQLGIESKPGMALLVCASRLEPQKGMSLFEAAREQLMSRNVALVIASSGTRRYTELARRMVELFPGRVAFSEEIGSSPLVHQAIAAADIILLPSEYEPCGLWQFVAMRYGTLPLARRTGGLADSIEDDTTGFLFDEYRDSAFLSALDRALAAFSNTEVWSSMQRKAMEQDWSWTHSARQYIGIYKELATPCNEPENT